MQPRLDLRLSQRLIMTPQLQQAIKLLQLSRLELQEALTQQMEENPLLEEGAAELEELDAEPGAEEPSAPAKREEENTTSGAEESGRDDAGSSWDEYFDDDRKWGDVE